MAQTVDNALDFSVCLRILFLQLRNLRHLSAAAAVATAEKTPLKEIHSLMYDGELGLEEDIRAVSILVILIRCILCEL